MNVNPSVLENKVVPLLNYALRYEGAWGSGCINPHFVDLGSFTPWPSYPRGKSPRYTLDRRYSGPQNRSGRRGEEKILDPTGTGTPISRSSSQ
jgi:hypothetical protein